MVSNNGLVFDEFGFLLRGVCVNVGDSVDVLDDIGFAIFTMGVGEFNDIKEGYVEVEEDNLYVCAEEGFSIMMKLRV